jgi:DNA invertase Pin-like site-specific DNA recombinase
MPDEACETTGRRLADGPGPLGPKTLTGQGAAIDTTTAQGRFAFTLFAALAEFERDLIVERTRAGLWPRRGRAAAAAGGPTR